MSTMQEHEGERIEDRANANAPCKDMTMSLVTTKDMVFVSTQDGVASGPRVVASGQCPGRGCTTRIGSWNPDLLHKLAACESGTGTNVMLFDGVCGLCGQRFKAWPRRIAVVR